MTIPATTFSLTDSSTKPFGAETLALVREFSDIAQLEEQLATWDCFAVKPANGRRGNGILVVVSREGADFRLASGKHISRDDLLHHCREITQGTFSMGGTRDLALLEALIEPEVVLHTLAPAGIADIRIILHRELRPIGGRFPRRETDEEPCRR